MRMSDAVGVALGNRAAARRHANTKCRTAVAAELLSRLVGVPQEGQVSFSAVPHSAQNLRPSLFSAAHFGQRILRAQLVEQRPGVFQVGSVEALGERA
jgi:hypothetical protein